MRESGLSGIPQRTWRGTTTNSKHTSGISPNILKRNFTPDRPNVAWVGDITYLSVRKGWVYLAVLIDLFSRKVVGWAVQDTITAKLCVQALHRAKAVRGDLTGTLHHSDRGAQYASLEYRTALRRHGMVQSMSRKGNCWDNAVAESFFGTLKQELIKGKTWDTIDNLREDLSDYIHSFYNLNRRHSYNGHISQVDQENNHNALDESAA